MAEPIGIASGLVALTTFAFQSSIALYKTVRSFRTHPRDVRELLEQLDALGGVLDSLLKTVQEFTDLDLSSLEKPLRRCGNACQEFEQELLKCAPRSGDKATFRGWAKLKYLGDDIDTFRRSLATYAATINVALADANLRRSSATANQVESYRLLVDTTTEDLEAHLDRIDEKIDSLLKNAVPKSGTNVIDLGLIKEERASTKKCLDICAKLSEHISQLQIVSGDDPTEPAVGQCPVDLTNESLQECRKQLSTAATKLESYMKNILDRLVTDSGTGNGVHPIAVDLARLREEWETTHQCRKICDTMGDNLNKTVSTIENHGSGDSLQIMVSTTGQVIHGKNQGLGWRNRQIGGHLSDESIQQLSRDIVAVDVGRIGGNASPPWETGSSPVKTSDKERQDPKFDARHGPGIKLDHQSKSPTR